MATRRMPTALVVVAALAAVAVVAWPDDPAPAERSGSRVVAGRGMATLEPRGGVGDVVAVVIDDERDPLFPRSTLVRASLDGRVVWRRFFPEPGALDVVAAERGVVVVHDFSAAASLVALDADDGDELWRVPQLEELTTTAPFVVGDRVVVPGRDGAVRALDLETGEEVWSLDDPENTSGLPPSIEVVDDGAVLVTRTRARYGIELVPVDLDDGAEGPAYAPECPGTRGRDPERAGAGAEVRVVPGTAEAVAVFGTGSQCVQRWSTTTGTQTWSTTTVPEPDGVEGRPVTPRAVALDEDHLAFDGADGIVVVDLADGTHRVVPAGDVAPLYVIDGTVVTAAVDDRGARPELTGVAVDGDEPLWAGVRIPGASTTARLVGGDQLGITPDAPVVVARRDEELVRTVEVEGTTRARITSVDPATGETTETTTDLDPDAEGAPPEAPPASVRILEGGRALVVVTGIPHLVDLATGAVVASWPVGG